MNLVPTRTTRKIAQTLIAETATIGAEATKHRLPLVEPQQIPALVAYLADQAAIKRGLPKQTKEALRVARGAARRARIAKEDAEWTDAEIRRAHARFVAGARDDWSVIGNRIYHRHARRRQRGLPPRSTT